jgi:hypothetical protein
MKINDEGKSNAAYWYERAMKAEARLGGATGLLQEAVGYLRPGEQHDAAYKDFSRRLAEFL